MEKSRLETAMDFMKEFCKEHKFEDIQMFNTRNVCGDVMENLLAENGVYIDICWGYGYIEVFGLTEDEFNELYTQYDGDAQLFPPR